jgi:polysaccharide pyruvyl transferase WcaK-like protein
VFAGGGRYGTATLRRMALLAVLAKLTGKRVEYRAVGLYPYQWSGTVSLHSRSSVDFLTRLMLKVAFSVADSSSVRDEYSKRFVEGQVTGRRVFLEPDPALKLVPDASSAARLLQGLGLSVEDVIVGFNARLLRDRAFYGALRSVVKALNSYLRVNRRAKLLYLPFGYGSRTERFFDDDVELGHLLGKLLSRDVAERYHVLEREVRPSTMLGLFQLLRAAITVRYHALVFASMCGTPVLSIAYDTKVLEYVKLMGRLGRRIEGIVVRPDEVSEELVLSFLRRYVG